MRLPLILVAVPGFLFGYDSGVITSTIGQPTFISYFGTPNSSQKGGIVSSFTGGAIVGALAISWLADMLGRKKAVFLGGCISALGCALQAGSATIAMLIAGRFIAGIAVGLLSAIVPMYCVSCLEALAIASFCYLCKLINNFSSLKLLNPAIVVLSVACCSLCYHGGTSRLSGSVTAVTIAPLASNV